MSERAPIPVRLKKGEREVIRVEGVKCVVDIPREGFLYPSTQRLHHRGFLLLTDQRLISCGTTWSGVHVIEASLDDVLGCKVEKPRFEDKLLSVKIRRMVWRFPGGETPIPFEPVPGEVIFVDIKQPEVLRSEIMEQVERYKKMAELARAR